jgi:hypothetical protein
MNMYRTQRFFTTAFANLNIVMYLLQKNKFRELTIIFNALN